MYTISVKKVKWVEFEHCGKPPQNIPRRFRLKPKTYSCTIQFPLTSDCEDLTMHLGNARVAQIPVNSNIATTGHKLQGMSKDTLIVNSWNYQFSNWIYVVLSRVRTLSGLFLCRPLDLHRPFIVPEKLIQFETRMKQNKTHFLYVCDMAMSASTN